MKRILAIFTALLCLDAMSAGEPAAPADPLQAAVQRRAWTWFGLEEAAASQRAKERKVPFLVVRRDGQDTSPAGIPSDDTVQLTLQRGVVISVAVLKPPLQEGAWDPALIPLLGLAEAEVVRRAKELGRPVRTTCRDGEYFAATMDYLETRLNLTVVGGLVVAITTG